MFLISSAFAALVYDPLACLSGAAILAWRQRGQKKCGPRQRGRKFERRAARSQRDGSAVTFFAHLFLIFIYNTYLALRATETGSH